MTERKKKLRILQGILLFFGIVVVILLTQKSQILRKTIFYLKKKKNDLLTEETKNAMFFIIEYSGIDPFGNRYILKSEEAINDKINPDLIKMKLVEAIFYFKDGKILNLF